MQTNSARASHFFTSRSMVPAYTRAMLATSRRHFRPRPRRPIWRCSRIQPISPKFRSPIRLNRNDRIITISAWISACSPDSISGLMLYYKDARDLIDDGQFGQAVVLTQFNWARGYSEGGEFKLKYTHDSFYAMRTSLTT